MNCPLTNGYTYPCRQVSGIQSVYLAGQDSTFKIEPSMYISTISIGYQDTIEGGSDTYTPGTYSIPLQFLNTDSDLFYDTDQFDQYYLPNSWVNATITIHFGSIPVSGYQPITVSISNIVNNYGLNTNFYIALSDIGSPYTIPYTDNGDSIFLYISLNQGDTYQVGTFSRNFYHFNQRLEQSGYVETEIYGENGSVGYQQSLEITLEGYDQKTKNIISILNKNIFRSIILDPYGNYYLVGYQNYITTTTAEGGLGKILTDGVKTTLTLQGKEPLMALSLDQTVVLSGLLN